MLSRMRIKDLVTRLRGWVAWIAAAFAIVVGAYLVVPSLVPDRLVQEQINKQIGRWTGGAFELRANAKISIEPGFRVVVSDPAFVSRADIDATPILTTDTIVAPLKVLPLLLGRVEIAELTLLRPDIDLRMSAQHFAASAQPAIGIKPAPAHDLGEVILVDGTLRFDGEMGTNEVSGLNMRLGTDALTNAVAMRGGAIVGPRHLRFDFQVDDLRALASDVGTQATLNVRMGPRHDGEPQDDATASAQGMPYEISETLWQVADAFGLSRGGLSTVAIDGVFSVTPQVVTVSDATFSLGGVEIEGHLRAETTDRPVMAQLLDFPAAANALIARTAAFEDGSWANEPVTMTWLDGLDVDIALVGDGLTVGASTLDTAAVSMALQGGAASIDVVGTSEGFGQLEANLAIEQETTDAINLVATGRIDTSSVAKITQLAAAIGPPPLIGTAQLPDGTMNGIFDVNARGGTLGQLLGSLNGSVAAQLTDGSLVGTDLVTTLETLVAGREFMTDEHGPLIPAAGRTYFDRLDARIDFAAGVARLSDVHIAGEQFGIDMLGEVVLAQGTMNIGGNAVLLSAPDTVSTSAGALVDLPFGVGGTLFDPVVAPGVPVITAQRIDAYAEN